MRFGGDDRQTLFLTVAEWSNDVLAADGPRTGRLLMVQAPAAGAG